VWKPARHGRVNGFDAECGEFNQSRDVGFELVEFGIVIRLDGGKHSGELNSTRHNGFGHTLPTSYREHSAVVEIGSAGKFRLYSWFYHADPTLSRVRFFLA
jgi:hypothetical protein